MKQIIHRYTLVVLFTAPNATTLREAVKEAIQVGADLSCADLSCANLSCANLGGANLGGADLSCANLGGANLGGADLRSADLGGANLGGANLGGADLRCANLSCADLSCANLSCADLRSANLRCANLGGANLRSANLGGADLGGANLGGANLSCANLKEIKADIFDVISKVPNEVPGLIVSLRIGLVEGSAYEGACACLVGTVANVKGCHYNAIEGLTPTAGRPAERWFLGIQAGDTPATNQVARITEGWLLEWVKEHSPKAAEAIAADDAQVVAIAQLNAARLVAASALSTMTEGQ